MPTPEMMDPDVRTQYAGVFQFSGNNQKPDADANDAFAEIKARLQQLNEAKPEPRPAPRPMLEVLCGLPLSGKSTYARLSGAPIVCPDSIRLALHRQRFVAEAEPFVWAIAKTMVRALFLSGHKHVILDACNVTEKRRREWENPDVWQTEFTHVDTPTEVCLERADREGDTEILPVIERMAHEWEPTGPLATVVRWRR